VRVALLLAVAMKLLLAPALQSIAEPSVEDLQQAHRWIASRPVASLQVDSDAQPVEKVALAPAEQ
jgi:hypothetical protein